MNKRSIKIPERCSAQIKEMWEDSEGFWAAAAPGWCFDTLSGYLLFAETEEELMAEAGSRIRPEEYEVQDLDGQRGSVISYERACSLLPQLRAIPSSPPVPARTSSAFSPPFTAGIRITSLWSRRTEQPSILCRIIL